MKAERLFSTLAVLLERRKVSAAELAREFGVSTRTVYRDLESLALAGVPLFSTPGREGGFELVDGFALDRQHLRAAEAQAALAGLEGLAGALPGPAVEAARKFKAYLGSCADKGVAGRGRRVFIELSPASGEREAIGLIQTSIDEAACLSLTYTDVGGRRSARCIEPEALVFYWQAWYAYAWCRLREDFRLFRISRIEDAALVREPRRGPPAELDAAPWRRYWDKDELRPMAFDAPIAYLPRIRETFGESRIEELGGGAVRVTALMPVNDWTVSVLSSLPCPVTLRYPEELRALFVAKLQATLRLNDGAAEIFQEP